MGGCPCYGTKDVGLRCLGSPLFLRHVDQRNTRRKLQRIEDILDPLVELLYPPVNPELFDEAGEGHRFKSLDGLGDLGLTDLDPFLLPRTFLLEIGERDLGADVT